MNKFISILNKHKVVVSMFLCAILCITTLITYSSAVNQSLDLISVPVAKHQLNSGQLITLEDIAYINICKHQQDPLYIVDINEIVNKRVEVFNSVAQNSMFYEGLLTSEDEISDSSIYKLNSGEVAVQIDADIKSSYANSIIVGHNVDLYYQGNATSYNSEDNIIVYGQIVKSARVIDVKDKDGFSMNGEVFETDVIVVALKQEDAHIVNVAKALGYVSPIISYDNLNESSTNNYYDLEKMKQIILGNSIDVILVKSEKDE